jgi:hypothetical protein
MFTDMLAVENCTEISRASAIFHHADSFDMSIAWAVVVSVLVHLHKLKLPEALRLDGSRVCLLSVCLRRLLPVSLQEHF